MEKARAFFRSLELKHLGGGGGGSTSSEHSSSSSSQRRASTNKKTNVDIPPPISSTKIPQTSSMSSSSSSSIIDDTHQTNSTTTTTTTTNPSSFTTSNCIATARIIRVINPKDVIVHRSMESNQDDSPMSSSSYVNMPRVVSPKHYHTYSHSSGKYPEMQTAQYGK